MQGGRHTHLIYCRDFQHALDQVCKEYILGRVAARHIGPRAVLAAHVAANVLHRHDRSRHVRRRPVGRHICVACGCVGHTGVSEKDKSKRGKAPAHNQRSDRASWRHSLERSSPAGTWHLRNCERWGLQLRLWQSEEVKKEKKREKR